MLRLRLGVVLGLRLGVVLGLGLGVVFRGVYSCTTFDYFPPPGPLIFFPAGSKYS